MSTSGTVNEFAHDWQVGDKVLCRSGGTMTVIKVTKKSIYLRSDDPEVHHYNKLRAQRWDKSWSGWASRAYVPSWMPLAMARPDDLDELEELTGAIVLAKQALNKVMAETHALFEKMAGSEGNINVL